VPRRKRYDDWLDDDEYPDDKDVEDLGDDSPWDDDPLTIGRVRNYRPRSGSPYRLALAAVAFLLLVILLYAALSPLLNR
jgi:hypothetical protein